jgi:hypothetical protein
MSFPLLGGRRLVFAGMEFGWLWLFAGAVALALILTLYRYERKLVSRRAGLTLLAMRIAAAVALTVALFEPIAERTFRETLRGRVIVGVDLSESMATADAERSPENRDALAKELNLSTSEPVANLTRREIARRLVQGGWRKALDAEHKVEFVGFARDSVAATPEILNDLMKQPIKDDDFASRTTDWVPVLERALKSPDGAPVLGVVLLTDGRANGTTDDDATITRLKERGIPVYPVLIGSTALPRDAAITSIKAPETVDKDQTAKIEVTVKIDGMPEGLEVPVTLERPSASPIRKTVRAQADGGRPVVSFSVPMETVGEQSLNIAVGPIDDDARPDNDRRALKINVVDDKARVLLVDGDARWEFRYLRNALKRDERVAVDAVLFHQPPTAASNEGVYPAALPARPEDSKLADPLGIYDLIILGDVSREDVDTGTWKRLDDYVAQRGGTLVLSSGPKSWPGALPEESAVRALLPVTDVHLVPVDPAAINPTRPSLPAGTAVLPTAAASRGAWPMLQFADENAASLTVWQGLPKLPWVVVGKAKPTATVLASTPTAGATEHESAAIAAMPYGLGKVLWIGTDATWRWRFRVGDAYHHRFWGQTVQWAARGKLAAGNRLVQFGPVSPRVTDGDAPLIRARFADDAPDVRPDLLVAARIYRRPQKSTTSGPEALGEPIAIVPLRPKADQPRVFEAAAPTLAPGPYLVRLDVPQLADAMKAEGPVPQASLEIVPRETSERIELSANRDPLDRLAAATGGKVVTDAEAASLADALHSRVVTKTRVEPTRVWDRPEALLIFFGLLTIEWVVRKRSGLP